MKAILAGIILAIIATALFLLLMGSDDASHVPFLNIAGPLLFVYGFTAYGLRQYRHGHHVIPMFGFVLLCFAVAFVVFVSAFRPPFPVATAGRILFAGALADIVVAFFIPLRVDRQKGEPNQAPDRTPPSGAQSLLNVGEYMTPVSAPRSVSKRLAIALIVSGVLSAALCIATAVVVRKSNVLVALSGSVLALSGGGAMYAKRARDMKSKRR